MKKDIYIISFICLLVISLITIEMLVKTEESIPMINIMQIPDLQEIDLNFPCQLFIQQGEEQKIAMEGSANLINKTEHKIKDGRLILRRNQFFRNILPATQNSSLVTIYITLNNIENIIIEGSVEANKKGYNAGNRLSISIGKAGAVIMIKT